MITFSGSRYVTEVTGFIFTNAQIICAGGVFNVHDNTVTNGRTGIYVQSQIGHFDRNAFTHLGGFGIYGYPGNGNTFDNNSFDAVWEPIHLIAQCNNTEINNNVITHASRIGIELQSGMTHLTVSNNWVSDWLPFLDKNGLDAHMGISCATGGSGTPPYPGQGKHITISGNVLIQNGPSQNNNIGAKAAIEIMGDEDINITGNYAWGWDCGVLNGCTGQGVNSSNNIWVCNKDWSGDGVGWPNPAPHGIGEQGLRD